MHENPQVRNFVSKEMKKTSSGSRGAWSWRTEPMSHWATRAPDVKRDQWTVTRADGLPSAHVDTRWR